MLGWVNDCLEQLICDKFGVAVWQSAVSSACASADTDIKERHAFKPLESYDDEITFHLVAAASQETKLSQEELLEALGEFFFHSLVAAGTTTTESPEGQASSVLKSAASTLRDWLASFQLVCESVFGAEVSNQMPHFFCQDQMQQGLTLHYWSPQGAFLVPFAQGLVSEAAGSHFKLDITLEPIALQGQGGNAFTSWKLYASDPQEQWKISQTKKCPVTSPTPATVTTSPTTPHSKKKRMRQAVTQDEEGLQQPSTASNPVVENGIGLSATLTRSLFPYHIMINADFTVKQVGNQLPAILNTTHNNILHKNVADVLKPKHPVTQGKWNWQWIQLQHDQPFEIETMPQPTTTMPYVRFKTTIVQVSKDPVAAMLILTPDVQNTNDLAQYDLAVTDLPVHTGQRQLLLAKQQLQDQKTNAQTMEKLQQSLEREKELLESLLPTHAAEGLRAGKSVEPRLHENVTFFFSDIVGFTSLSKYLEPGQVIDMLNQLYSIMDFLCGKFGLFKVETIGDAYVACSGLPSSDPNHARNVANFAVAVNHCCSKVLSPVDNKTPIQIRIGIHTGPCASGVVGTTNPRYCVFGDTVNQTSRHESSGKPSMIHCSGVTRSRLASHHCGLFELEQRGLVEMKGVGKVTTYWLSSSQGNTDTNDTALQRIDTEVDSVLAKTGFNTKFCPARRFDDVSRQVRKERITRMSLARSMIFASSINLSDSNIVISNNGEPLPPIALRPLTRVGSTLNKIGSSNGSLPARAIDLHNKATSCLSMETGRKRKRSDQVSHLPRDSSFSEPVRESANVYLRNKRDSSFGMVLSSSWDKLLE